MTGQCGFFSMARSLSRFLPMLPSKRARACQPTLSLLQFDDRVDALFAVIDRDLNDRVRLLDRGAGLLGFLERGVGRLRLPVDLQPELTDVGTLALPELLGRRHLLFGLGDLADDLRGLGANRHCKLLRLSKWICDRLAPFQA